MIFCGKGAIAQMIQIGVISVVVPGGARQRRQKRQERPAP